MTMLKFNDLFLLVIRIALLINFVFQFSKMFSSFWQFHHENVVAFESLIWLGKYFDIDRKRDLLPSKSWS